MDETEEQRHLRLKAWLRKWGNFTSDWAVETYSFSMVDVMSIMEEFRGEARPPLRLEIAARLLAGKAESWDAPTPVGRREVCMDALKWADALIDAHNETCQEAE